MSDPFVGLTPLAVIRRMRVLRMLSADVWRAAYIRRKHLARRRYQEDHEKRLAFAIKVANGTHLEVDDDEMEENTTSKSYYKRR
jgi:hypothetical protein